MSGKKGHSPFSVRDRRSPSSPPRPYHGDQGPVLTLGRSHRTSSLREGDTKVVDKGEEVPGFIYRISGVLPSVGKGSEGLGYTRSHDCSRSSSAPPRKDHWRRIFVGGGPSCCHPDPGSGRRRGADGPDPPKDTQMSRTGLGPVSPVRYRPNGEGRGGTVVGEVLRFGEIDDWGSWCLRDSDEEVRSSLTLTEGRGGVSGRDCHEGDT